MSFRTRFAPSPTGPLHLGHAYSAMLAHDMARAQGGEFLLRIEDIDTTRSRPEWEEKIYDDLRWLGLSWEEPVMRQSERMDAYTTALTQLWNAGLLFKCTCNRRDIAEAATAPQEGTPRYGPDGVIYPGTCRERYQRTRTMPLGAALRLDMKKVSQIIDRVVFQEAERDVAQHSYVPEFMCQSVGDVVLARRDMGTSYHLSVVVDDAEQGITHVVRGEDLFDATQIHVVLQRLLNLPTPAYYHHRLIRDDVGKRLAKRDDARAISKYRADGASPADVRQMIGL
ncbi:MAG: tRNA glutamyl-Q(34) synthetase GluQRS [Pseudomonadota bacterium]